MPPPLPAAPPPQGPPPPGAALRSAAAGLLNLSGLGLGYLLTRAWLRAAACLAATVILLLVAFPADPDGVPAGWLAGYVLVLLVAAVDGARTARRTPVAGSWKPVLAAALGLVLLAAPLGGTLLYRSAHDEAVEEMLLDRLHDADDMVETAAAKPFAAVKREFGSALAVYRDLGEKHAGSRAGKQVPAHLKTYYEAVATPYRNKEYCTAVEPLTYLRTLPNTVDAALLGDLKTWPNGPLADSLYDCGLSRLGEDTGATGGGELGELLRTFPDSEQAGKVGPAVAARIQEQVDALGGDDPCATTTVLESISTTAAGLPGDTGAKAGAQADRGVRDGVYACGLDEFEDDKFTEARTTLTEFAEKYPSDDRRSHARKVAIAAEIAEDRPAAGRKLPPAKAPGGPTMELVISNDAPNAVEILYTGPVTGTVSLKACGSCARYDAATGSSRACKASGKSYPKVRLRLPAGDYHFLYKHGTGASASVDSYTDGAKIESGYTYTSCTYLVSEDPFGGLDIPDFDPVGTVSAPGGRADGRVVR
ncbi:hypothetical protein [uncultured Streptomyces sp.]|uniref:hypothetical protein n=1 Tax=uncultured Streptomyces sp. TaxID=174707 RepID=UPI0026218476|nr:hypothetical protein [uncultured Streptomyces sp.]